jgi:hypothetical protein
MKYLQFAGGLQDAALDRVAVKQRTNKKSVGTAPDLL